MVPILIHTGAQFHQVRFNTAEVKHHNMWMVFVPRYGSYLSTLGQSSFSGKRVKVKHNSFSVPFKIWMVVFQDMFFVIHTMGPTATSSVLKYTSGWPQLPCLTLLTFPCSTVLYLAPNNLAQAWPGLLDPLLI